MYYDMTFTMRGGKTFSQTTEDANLVALWQKVYATRPDFKIVERDEISLAEIEEARLREESAAQSAAFWSKVERLRSTFRDRLVAYGRSEADAEALADAAGLDVARGQDMEIVWGMAKDRPAPQGLPGSQQEAARWHEAQYAGHNDGTWLGHCD